MSITPAKSYFRFTEIYNDEINLLILLLEYGWYKHLFDIKTYIDVHLAKSHSRQESFTETAYLGDLIKHSKTKH